MRTFIEHARFYAGFHQNPLARYFYLAAVPFFILSFMILLGFVKVIIPGVLDINLADIVTVILLGFYFRLNWRLAIMMIVVFTIFLWVAEYFSYEGPTPYSLWVFLVFLLFGIGLMAPAYYYEKHHHYTWDILHHIWAVPLIWIAELIFLSGWMSEFRTSVYGANRPVRVRRKNKK